MHPDTSTSFVLRHAYGLIVGSGYDAESKDAQHIAWTHTVVTHLPLAPSFSIRPLEKPDGFWTQHAFAAAGVTHCVFDVSPDGRSLQSWALPTVHADDVLELCCETVMRTVLCRLGYPSFHSAALSKDGRAILLMGRKGAGKSTLSFALQQQGWTLLADDLARVETMHDTWKVFPGVRRNKLRADSMTAVVKHSPEARRRWVGIPPPEADDEKLMVSSHTPLEDSSPLPIDAVVCLGRRVASSEVVAQTIQGPVAVLHLTEHLTRDPLPPHCPPQRSTTMLSELLRQATIHTVQLPDTLAQLSDSAAALNALIRPSATT